MNKEELTKAVEKFMKGEKDAFSQIYMLTNKNFYAYALLLMKNDDKAEDLLQDTYIKIIKYIDQLKNPAAFITWSKKVLYSVAMRTLGKDEGQNLVSIEGCEHILDNLQEERVEFIPGEEFDHEEIRQIVFDVINQLPVEQRAAILSFYYDEMSVKEISYVMNCSEGTVKSRLFTGRNTIKTNLEAYQKTHDIRLYAALPTGLIFGVLNNLDKLYVLSEAKSASILQGVLGKAMSGSATAMDLLTEGGKKIAAKKTLHSGIKMGVNKFIAMVVASTLVIGGAGVGIHKIVTNNKDDAIQTIQETRNQEILDTYSAYFTKKMIELQRLENDDDVVQAVPLGIVIDNDHDKIPEFIIYYTTYHASNYTVCTYQDGKIIEIPEDGVVYDFVNYGVTTYISKDQKTVSIVYEGGDIEQDGTSSYNRFLQYHLTKEGFKKTDDILCEPGKGDDYKTYKKNLVFPKGTKRYSNQELINFYSTSDFADYLSTYGIGTKAPGKETDWKTAYKKYFSEMIDQHNFSKEDPIYLAVEDINSDGIPEILMDGYRKINAFTFANGSVQSLFNPYDNWSGGSARIWIDKKSHKIALFDSEGSTALASKLEILDVDNKGFLITDQIILYPEESAEYHGGYPLDSRINWKTVSYNKANRIFIKYDVYHQKLKGAVKVSTPEEAYEYFKEVVGIEVQ